MLASPSLCTSDQRSKAVKHMGDKLRLKGLCPQTCFGHNVNSQPRKGGAGTELLIPIATVSATSSASGFVPRTGWKQQFFLGVHLPIWNSKPKTKAGMCRHFYCTHKRSRSAQADLQCFASYLCFHFCLVAVSTLWPFAQMNKEQSFFCSEFKSISTSFMDKTKALQGYAVIGTYVWIPIYMLII